MKKLLLMMIPIMAMTVGCKQGAEKVPAIDLSDLDTTVAPGENFYKYADGGWKEKNPLKAEYARYGSFDYLNENNQIRLNELFESMATMKADAGSVDQKISDLYKQGLDSAKLNADGNAPILKYVDEIYAIADKAALTAKIAELHNSGDGCFFGAGAEADLMNSKMQVLYLGQGGLGIGERDYYVNPENSAIKEGYRTFLTKIFTLTGIADPEKAAANALYVEEQLAEASWTRVQNRDYTKLYNPMSTDQIAAAYPGFDFKSYFEARGIAPQEKAILEQPSFFEAFSKLYDATELHVLKDYVAGQFISGACGAISDDYYDASFDFFSTQMSGVTEKKPRWKRAMAVPNGILGEAVGKMYVERYFPESSKQDVTALVENLRTALSQHIAKLEWMGEDTKKYAQEKLAAFTVKIGYPDKWKDYSTMEISADKSYFENLRAASIWYIQDNLSKVGKETDPTEWGMSPQTVNAYYNPTTNEICFPAAILQPPFYNPDADAAVNYGAIGVVIGHEMTHGFDDQGRLFDKDGNMTNWWTEEDDKAFREKAEVLAAQFDAVEIQPGVMANGHLTLGENIADHGGLSIAYTALHNALGGVEPEPIDGFTADQRFYLGYAHVWAQNSTPEEDARLTKVDPHSLAVNRVNVSLRNFQTFFDAFGIKEGDAMFRPESERVHIW